ncbi:PPHLN protein, partial [Anhinga anhinga]|nr:PPHLN protein [Anhinga anhinga]
RDIRDGFRRKSFYPSHYMRERSPHKRDSPFFRESPGSRRDSPHSRSGSSVSSRSYSPERSKAYPFHQSQHSRSMSSLHKRNISSQQGNAGLMMRAGKERMSVQSLKTSRDVSPSGSTAAPSSKALDKSNRLSEKELVEAASKWAAEKSEKADESNLPEITEYDVRQEAGSSIHQSTSLEFMITMLLPVYRATDLLGVALNWKRKIYFFVYRQDCETFGMVVKMLIDKDPSLEKSIQFALRQNLHEIGERCIEELKHFIAQYDAANQDLSESF